MFSSFTSGKKFIFKNTISCIILYEGKILIDECVLEFEYSVDKPGIISGTIHIDNQDYDKFEKIENYSALEIKSIDDSQDKVIFYSNSFIINYAAGSDLDISVSNAFFDIRLNSFLKKYTTKSNTSFLEKLSKPFDINIKVQKTKVIRYLITGPYELWKKSLFDGEDYEIKFENYILKIKKGFLYERENEDNDEFTISKSRYYLDISEIVPSENAVDQFTEETKEFVEYFLSLSSFLSDFNITWWSYTLFDGNDITDFVKSIDNNNLNFREYSSLLFSYEECKTILQTYFERFVNLDKSFIDLKTPILQFISKNYASDLPQIFTIAYIAFETICIEFANNQNSKKIIKERKKFEEISKQFKNLIKSLDLSQDEKQNMQEKIVELNQVPIKKLFEIMFNYYNIQISESLYTEDKSTFKFLKVRNKLIHGDSKKINPNDVYNSIKDIEHLFVNLILRIIGSDKTYSKNYIHF
jgi:hypothetical protein